MNHHIYASDIPSIVKIVLPNSDDLIIYQNMNGNGHIIIEVIDIHEMVRATHNIGIPRKQIEGLILYDIQTKHDRNLIDDTSLTNKQNLYKIEYTSIDLIPIIKPNIVLMTDFFKTINYNDFLYTNDRKIQSKQRHYIKTREQVDSIQICWNTERYEQLHDIKQRFNMSGQYNAKLICGNPSCQDTNEIPIVKWKDEFCSINYNDWKDDTIYIYHTTKNTFKIFTTMKICRIGTLQHSSK